MAERPILLDLLGVESKLAYYDLTRQHAAVLEAVTEVTNKAA